MFLTAVIAAVMCACGEEKEESSVKVPKSTTEPLMSYDEAIEEFKYDKKINEIADWGYHLKGCLLMVFYYDLGCESSWSDETASCSNIDDDGNPKTIRLV